MQEKQKKQKPSFESYARRLRNLKNWRGLEYSSFLEIAKKRYFLKYGNAQEEKIPDIAVENIVGVWLDKEEADKALELFENYKKKYHIEALSDVELLKQYIYSETLLNRVKKILDSKPDKIQTRELGIFNDLVNQNLTLKEKLGLLREKRDSDPLKYINLLKKKFEIWRKENLGRTVICPHCSKMIYLKFRTDKYDAIKHPFFPKDKVIANEHLWNMYKKGKINKEDVSKVLGTSVFYVDWLEKNFFKDIDSPAIKESGD